MKLPDLGAHTFEEQYTTVRDVISSLKTFLEEDSQNKHKKQSFILRLAEYLRKNVNFVSFDETKLSAIENKALDAITHQFSTIQFVSLLGNLANNKLAHNLYQVAYNVDPRKNVLYKRNIIEGCNQLLFTINTIYIELIRRQQVTKHLELLITKELISSENVTTNEKSMLQSLLKVAMTSFASKNTIDIARIDAIASKLDHVLQSLEPVDNSPMLDAEGAMIPTDSEQEGPDKAV